MDDAAFSNTGIAGDQIRSLVERINRLKDEQDEIGALIREVYAEAKSQGFDKAALGKIVTYVRNRAKNSAKVEEAETLFDLYLDAYENGASRTHAHAREGSHASLTGEAA